MAERKKKLSTGEKGSREKSDRVSHKKARTYHGNRYDTHDDPNDEPGPGPATTCVKKILAAPVEVDIQESCGYVVLDFECLFGDLAAIVNCKNCSSDVSFEKTSERGLGFRLNVVCKACGSIGNIKSSRLIGAKKNKFEVNSRSVLAARCAGLGEKGLNTFCAVMDLHSPVSTTQYTAEQHIIAQACEEVSKDSKKLAVQEEVQLTKTDDSEGNDCLCVSGDGSWKTRGHQSRVGVAALIGSKTGKIIDTTLRSTYCKECEWWENNNEGTEDYNDWIDRHMHECLSTHEGSAGSMESKGVLEMFKRSEELYGVRYKYYVGDGDTSSFRTLVDSKVYGEDFTTEKKECVNHVQKRMGTRLRNLKKEAKDRKLSDKKTMGGKGRLTNALITDLAIYYGMAIRANPTSVTGMQEAIMATLYHKASTDDKPQHQLCSRTPTTWCGYWRAVERREKYKHPPAIPPAIVEVLLPIYKDLSADELMARCIGGYHQNNNECFHSVLWTMAPKHLYSGPEVVKIALDIATILFNRGNRALLLLMSKLDILPGPTAQKALEKMDQKRIKDAEAEAAKATKEARRARRLARLRREAEEDQRVSAHYAAGAHE